MSQAYQTEEKQFHGKTYNLDSEVLLLANLIYNNNGIDDVDFLSHEHFYNPIHAEIFKTIKLGISRGSVADFNYILSEMHSNPIIKGILESEEISKFLSSIMQKNDVYIPKHHADLIYKLYLKRRLVEIGQSAVSSVDFSAQDIKSKIQEIESDLYLLSDPVNSQSFMHVGKYTSGLVETLDKVRKNTKRITGLESGFVDLDGLLGGLKGGDLIILAARPSMGKTALAVSMAYNVAKILRDKKEQGAVGFFSLEMSSEQIVTRLASGHLGLNSRVFETGMEKDERGNYSAVSDSDFREIAEKIQEIDSLQLYIDSTPSLDILSLRSRVRKLKRKTDVRVVFVDYLQLLKGYYNKSDNRVQEISEITQGLKAIAREMKVPIIALSQLSRGVEQRENKRPQLSDLRESGTIEQDADIVMFLFREAYYLERDKPEMPQEVAPDADEVTRAQYAATRRKAESFQLRFAGVENLAELIIAKNRNGPTGNIGLAFDKERVRFENRLNNDVYDAEEYNPFVKH